jgi:hypothetical protein
METFGIIGLVIIFVIAGIACQHVQIWTARQTLRFGPLAFQIMLVIGIICVFGMLR